MRRLLAVVVSALLAGAALTGWASAGVTASPGPHVEQVALHSAYLSYLSRERPEPRGVLAAPGRRRSTATPRVARPATCTTEPACPLLYNGGSVQHTPHVYLLLWGSSWSTTGGVAGYLESLLSGLGVTPQDAWSPTMEQYGDGTGNPTFGSSVYVGVYQDATNPVPSGTTQTQFAAEADAFYTTQGLSDPTDDQIVIATPSGTCPAGFYAPSAPCNDSASNAYCAYHSATTVNTVPYTNLPYLIDGGTSSCNASADSYLGGSYNGFSVIEGHEYAETVTDPVPDTGWIDTSDPGGGEIGDKCAWVYPGTQNSDLGMVTLSTGSFGMQPLWSNSADKCVLTNVTDPTVIQTPEVMFSYNVRLGATPSSSSLPVTVQWDVSAGSAPVCTLQVQRSVSGGAWSSLKVASPSAISTTDTMTQPGKEYLYRIDATGCDGGTSGWVDGTTFSYSVHQESDHTLWSFAPSTAWKAAACSSCSGGHVEYSTAQNATASMTVTGYGVALVTETGPTLGEMNVAFDGLSGSVFNEHATKAGYRLILIRANFLALSTHTLTITNLATAGHPRIDLDAAVVLGP